MKTITVLTLAMFVVGAIAAPVMADPDHADDRKQDAKDKQDEHAEKRDKAAEKRDDAAEKRDAAMAKHVERRDAAIAKAQERCDKYENRTGRELKACDRLDEVHDEPKSARRAAHALMKAIDALEHRVVTLEKLEVKFMEKLEGENLTANQTAAYEAKIVRIQAAQNQTLDKLEKMEHRLEHLKEKWDKVRDHMDAHKKVLVCHQGDDGNHTIRVSRMAADAHLRHGDELGACDAPNDVADEAVSDEPSTAASTEADESGADEAKPSDESGDPAQDGSEEGSENQDGSDDPGQ